MAFSEIVKLQNICIANPTEPTGLQRIPISLLFLRDANIVYFILREYLAKLIISVAREC